MQSISDPSEGLAELRRILMASVRQTYCILKSYDRMFFLTYDPSRSASAVMSPRLVWFCSS